MQPQVITDKCHRSSLNNLNHSSAHDLSPSNASDDGLVPSLKLSVELHFPMAYFPFHWTTLFVSLSISHLSHSFPLLSPESTELYRPDHSGLESIVCNTRHIRALLVQLSLLMSKQPPPLPHQNLPPRVNRACWLPLPEMKREKKRRMTKRRRRRIRLTAGERREGGTRAGRLASEGGALSLSNR
jgi:hypothetical protein